MPFLFKTYLCDKLRIFLLVFKYLAGEALLAPILQESKSPTFIVPVLVFIKKLA